MCIVNNMQDLILDICDLHVIYILIYILAFRLFAYPM